MRNDIFYFFYYCIRNNLATCQILHTFSVTLNSFPAIVGEHRILIDASNPNPIIEQQKKHSFQWIPDDAVPELDGNFENQEYERVSHEHHPPSIEYEYLRPSKWLKSHGFHEITPTVPYQVDECLEKPVPAPNVGLQCLPAATLRDLLDQCRNAQDVFVCKLTGDRLKIVIFSSTISRWTLLTWASHGKTVKKLFYMVFPHFRVNFVKGLIDHDTEVELDSIPYANPFRIIRFCPVDFPCTVYLTCDQNRKLVHIANVTTKAGDWISYFAAKLNVSPCMLELKCKGTPVHHDAFILAEDFQQAFYIHWVVPFRIPDGPFAIEDDYDLALGNHSLQSTPSKMGGVESNQPHNDDNLFCFSMKHPVWNTIRTVSAIPQSPFSEVISKLLPDLTEGCEPVVKAGSFVFSACIKVEELPVGSSFCVELNGKKPYPTCVVHIIPYQVGLCLVPTDPSVNTGLFRRWIRSPFKVRAELFDFAGDTNLITIGGSFFAGVTKSQTIVVTLNSKVVDPSLLIKDTPSDITIGFRVCPLPGGGETRFGTGHYPNIAK